MDRVSILFAFDNPRHSGHLLLDEADKSERRERGNQLMNEIAFTLIRETKGPKPRDERRYEKMTSAPPLSTAVADS
jgi:hypothetical protein